VLDVWRLLIVVIKEQSITNPGHYCRGRASYLIRATSINVGGATILRALTSAGNLSDFAPAVSGTKIQFLDGDFQISLNLKSYATQRRLFSSHVGY